jgi:drug/metabolite transporter (DMT)-like permease
MAGIIFVLLSVVLISMGGSSPGESESNYIAVLLALLTGLTLSVSTVIFEYVISTGVNLDQANHDSNIILGTLYLPFFFVFKEHFTWYDIAEATALVMVATAGVIFFSRALQIGYAGPTQAIENTKTIVQSVMAAIFLGQIPSLIQIFGLISGLLGVTFIVIQKEKKSYD